jgi:hypothetical protein
MDSSIYRERAGMIVSTLVVMALIAAGPIQLAVQVYTSRRSRSIRPGW